ncbi:MAG: DUF4190 domain-containing protein [Bifidobacteriaceae bacterium]|nr:DUF4190 domain-containing protein [Bifidobacteriaceae bacterium]
MVIPHAPTNGLAVAALVCALVGVFVVPLAGSAVAIVLGAVALRQVKARNQAGRGMALAGLIVGIVGLVMWGFGIAAIIVTSDDYTYPEYNYTMSQLMTHFSPQLEVSL